MLEDDGGHRPPNSDDAWRVALATIAGLAALMLTLLVLALVFSETM